MGKNKFPSLTGKQIVNALKKAGGIEKRTNGSHTIIEFNDKIIVVPVHSNKDIPDGTLNSIIKQTGLTKKEFYKLFTNTSIVFVFKAIFDLFKN
ncbi:type II toxin-antitoxin system HicA family toxin [Caloramator sp. ALD01]|uniref:type II toxin-antitoxin system HicA family toxin n=1 Tax=Caloramator sp. ALD01 TaxID=1031288 RepID=UPI000426D889|nr:type II toxin-antitoxin system HicA family toxin [Caloramator sp. ALD01]